MTSIISTGTAAESDSPPAGIEDSTRAVIFGAAKAKPRTIINLHALHSVPASLLNRDNLNAQKTVTHGGVVRVRVSSQCWKRAMRTWLRERAITGGAFATRTNRWPAAVAEALAANHGVEPNVAQAKSGAVFAALGFTLTENGMTAAQIFAPSDTARRIAGAIAPHIDDISTAVSSEGESEGTGTARAKSKGKRAVKFIVPNEVIAACRTALSVANAVDLALFGRMLAEQPIGGRVDGAVSVDHAMSVDPAAILADFYTAVDDLSPEGEMVAGNLGATDLSAPVFYRTASIDVDQLRRNLSGAHDPDALTTAAVDAMVGAFINAVPAAKQRSSNVGTRPSLVVATVGPDRLTAHNAFTVAVRGERVVHDATAALFDILAAQRRFADPQEAVVLIGDPEAAAAVPAGITVVDSEQDLVAAVSR